MERDWIDTKCITQNAAQFVIVLFNLFLVLIRLMVLQYIYIGDDTFLLHKLFAEEIF